MYVAVSPNIKFNTRSFCLGLTGLCPSASSLSFLMIPQTVCRWRLPCKGSRDLQLVNSLFWVNTLYALLLFPYIVNDPPVGIFTEQWKTNLKETHDNVVHWEVIWWCPRWGFLRISFHTSRLSLTLGILISWCENILLLEGTLLWKSFVQHIYSVHSWKKGIFFTADGTRTSGE